MLDLLNKLTQNSTNLRFTKPNQEFIPYACHYSEDTILTKNGELLKIIQIPSFSIEKDDDSNFDVRETIRNSILNSIDTQNYSIWIHTIRSKQNMLGKLPYANGLPSGLNKAYTEDKNWNRYFVNDVYITIIRNGQNLNLKSLTCFINAMRFKKFKEQHDRFLEQSSAELDIITSDILNKIKKYGARILSIEKNEQGVFSKPLSFFKKLTSLSDQKIPISTTDISKTLREQNLVFGFNNFEIRENSVSKFGTIFGLKEYIDLPTRVLNRFLNAPIEFIISQSITFISPRRGFNAFERQTESLNISNDDVFKDLAGLKNIENLSENSSLVSFCESQINFTIYADDIEFLERANSISYDILSNMGYIVVRQDLRLEEYFWGSLPANFQFLGRKKIMPTALACGFAIIDESPTGQRYNNLWGENLTLFHRIDNMPYFFNFHDGFNGTSAILSSNMKSKNIFTLFLLMQANKYNNKLYYISPNKNILQTLSNLMNIEYIDIKPSASKTEPRFNPLALEDTESNRNFLNVWFQSIFNHYNITLKDEDLLVLKELINYNFTLPFELRHLNNICNNFKNDKFDHLKKYLHAWHGHGEFSWLFDNNDLFPFVKNAYLFDVEHIINNKVALDAFMCFIIQQIINRLDGTPTIIVLDEAWDLLDNQMINQSMLNLWINKAIENNAIILFTSSNINKAYHKSLHKYINDKLATLLIADNQNSDIYKSMFKLSDSELKLLTRIIMERYNFIVRQKNSTVINNFNLRDLRYLEMLSCSDNIINMIKDIKDNSQIMGSIDLEEKLLQSLIKYVQ